MLMLNINYLVIPRNYDRRYLNIEVYIADSVIYEWLFCNVDVWSCCLGDILWMSTILIKITSQVNTISLIITPCLSAQSPSMITQLGWIDSAHGYLRRHYREIFFGFSKSTTTLAKIMPLQNICMRQSPNYLVSRSNPAVWRPEISTLAH